MKKDLNSYRKHDSEFNTELNSLERTLEIVKHYDNIDQFTLLGFKQALRMSNPLPKIHIDIGSGNGWLTRKTSPIFEKVFGVEPSTTGVEVAKKITQEFTNITFINKDMIDGLKEINPTSPIFLTTATVLSHIEDFYVAEFLKQVNTLPVDSTLCFDERYDKNMQWNMWHIRSKEWWESKLPNWQLIFLNLENNGYASSIFGVCLGEKNTLKTHQMSTLSLLVWHISKLYHLSIRVAKKISSYIIKVS
jgi:SAM-dependent methyltransferase